ncbi:MULTISPECIES: transferase [unclassified Rhodococcus (in: high G+C Gram-positive bacteria)]|uniref:transferase n=1 Tax=unclassified Rhodococcus (in: high G+C Gram-positive bacteria) TaxID=192944 RepID=UPI00163AE495|nr:MULTISPECIES: transferase [unclassified Rhodococcus (in: high G+C Gram-positive bacteria)]MBC2642983.1 transferase [Rhodococcus sp. 3A]MBC2892275.1 transferase [Rhodococcus sp. 4CII]
MICRGCVGSDTVRVLDLGAVPAADHFPPERSAIDSCESAHPLAMELCLRCGLAQLAEDDTTPEEPRGVEPLALRNQAADAVRTVAVSGFLDGDTVLEFGSPHGGSWLGLLAARGFCPPPPGKPASVVLDCFGLMHEVHQRTALRHRADSTASDGVLLVQFHSLAAIVTHGQWNALRHGHYAYYSLTALQRLLGDVGMSLSSAWEFDLYGGTVLVAARHGIRSDTSPAVRRILAAENELGVCTPRTLGRLQHAADDHARALHDWLDAMAGHGRRVYAYGAASRAVALFGRAGIDRRLVGAVADASPAKQGRRMPGTNVPIISPTELVAADPDLVLLTVADLAEEVQTQLPQLTGKWVVDIPDGDGLNADRALTRGPQQPCWNRLRTYPAV